MTRSAPTTAYDDDFFVWTQEQAAALRRARSLANDIDIEHLAEEIEDMGKRDLREVCSFLRLMFAHLLKISLHPTAPDVPHWRSETRTFRQAAADAFTPGMRRMIVVADQWRKARKTVAADLRDAGIEMPAILSTCPFELDDLLSDRFDVDDALSRIDEASAVETAQMPEAHSN